MLSFYSISVIWIIAFTFHWQMAIFAFTTQTLVSVIIVFVLQSTQIIKYLIYIILDGSWNTSDPVIINVGSAAVPVSKMLPVGDKLWCSCHNSVKIFDTVALQFQVRKTNVYYFTNLFTSSRYLVQIYNIYIHKCKRSFIHSFIHWLTH